MCQAPPGFSEKETSVKTKKTHFVEIVIQISPPHAFSTPILPPPPSFSTTVTRPYFPKRPTVISQNSKPASPNFRKNSIRSSFRDSGLADISPHIGRRGHHQDHVSSSQSFINSASPTSGLSSDEVGTSTTGLATPTREFLSKNLSCNTNCCFRSKADHHKESGRKCLPFNLLNKRRTLRRERSQSLDDSSFFYCGRPNLDSEGAISCLDLPVSSLSTDIYEDEEDDSEKRNSNYRSALYAHWWLKAPVRKL
jgi:hypothetical protein